MASGSRTHPDDARWSVVDVKRFLDGYTEVSGIRKDKLVAAAVRTAILRDTISGFRKYRFKKEGKGPLYNLVKRVAPPRSEAPSESNPYADFVAKNPKVKLPGELAFLLEGYPNLLFPVEIFELGLSESDETDLTQALRRRSIPDWLMQPCRFLTFEENLDMRVQVARLWVERSELPIWIGSSITFKQMRMMEAPPEKPAGFSLEDDLPSSFVWRMREKTIEIYHLHGTLGLTVVHPTPQELPENCVEYYKAYARVGYPHYGLRGSCYPLPAKIGDDELDKLMYMDEVSNDLKGFRFSETPAMYELLAKEIFNLEGTELLSLH